MVKENSLNRREIILKKYGKLRASGRNDNQENKYSFSGVFKFKFDGWIWCVSQCVEEIFKIIITKGRSLLSICPREMKIYIYINT